ncbi:MAG: hypothetical protein ABIS13_09425, partial [Nitrosospira sp.]
MRQTTVSCRKWQFYTWQRPSLWVNSLSNRTTLSLKEDLMRSPVAEALAGSMIQYFHGGCKFFGG